jgi:LacI family transcriptional regulator
MATIVDVARIAGVSLSTVSHVMNGTRNVSDRTRDRVERAIRETGYVRDASARAMRRSRTDSVGLIVSDTGQPVFAEMVRGVEEEASQQGLTLLLANSAEDPRREAEALRVLAERRVDGLILAGSAHSDPALLDRWRSSGVPIVLLDRLGDPTLDQVGVDNLEPMAELVSHMLDHGHKKVALLAGDLAVATLAERRLGYLAALERHGLVPDPSLILTGTGMAADAEKAALELLQRADRPTALVTASTPMAAGALRAAARLGLRIPDDLAFAAFDNLPYGDLFSPPLTTVDQPAAEIGREAMRLLLRRLADPGARPSTVRLSPTFNHRASCCSASEPPHTPEPPAPKVGTRKKSPATTSRRRAGATSKG